MEINRIPTILSHPVRSGYAQLLGSILLAGATATAKYAQFLTKGEIEMKSHDRKILASMQVVFLAGLISIGFVGTATADFGELFKLVADDGQGGDFFGRPIAVSDGVAIIGASGDDDNGSDSGSAYLFDTFTGQQMFKLLPDDGATLDVFGAAVDISGDIAIVGAAANDDNGGESGSAYLFDINLGTQNAKLLPNDGAVGDGFGGSVAISGTIAIATGGNAAYVFDALTGQQLAKLVPDDIEKGELIGWGASVAIFGSTLIVGATKDSENGNSSGSAYLFDISSGQQIGKLRPDDGGNFDRFGVSVGISGSIAIVGSDGNVNENGVNAGSAYLFDIATGAQIDKLLPDDGNENDFFGRSVAISGVNVIVGAPGDDDNGNTSGSAYLFDLVTGIQFAKLLPSDGTANNTFGSSVAFENPTSVFIGAGGGTGAAYLFTSEADSDADGDGLLDTWETEGLDINNDGIVDVDFPGLGADRLHKDLFLEVDLMQTVPFDPAAIQDVINAFAIADIENPDGSIGINLHIDLATADTIPFETSWDRDFVRFGEIKNGVGGTEGLFGTQADRDSENSDAILEAKKRTFRYATVVNTILTNGIPAKNLLGVAERPGNDMMVAFGNLAGDRHVQGSTFMHEFGHNLNLEHGGFGPSNYKPNYVSVMNYGFDNWVDVDGNPLPLDFSSETMFPLPEEHLDETVGVSSAIYSDVLVYYGYDDGGTRKKGWIRLDGAPHDWNHDGSEDEDVSVDLNFIGPGYPDGNTASAGDVHFGSNDWELLLLPLGTTGSYEDSVHTPPPHIGKTVEDLIFMRENLPPPPIHVAEITNVVVNIGTLLEGDTIDLVESDQSYLHASSGVGSTTEIVVSATTDQQWATVLDVLVESRLSDNGGWMTLSLKNWSTGEFDSIESYVVGTDEEDNFFKDIDAANYIGSGGEIEVQIKDVVIVPFQVIVSNLGDPYEVFIDRVQITAR